MKDNFSRRSDLYVKFRPGYPDALFKFLISNLEFLPVRSGAQAGQINAWDCGTGNGQFAKELSKYFEKVYATDISEKQLAHAEQKPNIEYSRQPAEKTIFPNAFFDLVTVAQAIHWFDFKKFYAEVDRVLKPGGIFAVAGYSVFSSMPAIDKVIDHFYTNITGPYWDKERKYLDEHYQTIPVPTYAEIPSTDFISTYEWNYDQLMGYLSTWSAVAHYKSKNNADPLELIASDLKTAFDGKEKVEIRFPIHFRMWRKYF